MTPQQKNNKCINMHRYGLCRQMKPLGLEGSKMLQESLQESQIWETQKHRVLWLEV